MSRAKPTALKIVQGNPGKRRLNDAEPVPRSPVEIPVGISKEARAIWERIVSQAPPGLLTSVDQDLLRAYVGAALSYQRAERALAKSGEIIRAPKTGALMQSPWVAFRNRQAELLSRLGEQLGLNPSARSRIRVGVPGNDDDPYEKFRRRDKT